MATENSHKIACSAIDSQATALEELSKSLWERPEEHFEEFFAHATLTDYLEKEGFAVSRSHHLPTAFRAQYVPPQGDNGITIGIMCEYDALPEIGHACGHNLIAEAGVAAAIGIKAALSSTPDLQGRIVVIGTPDEEGSGGKIFLLNAGVFKDIDFCMMVHPGRFDIMADEFLAAIEVTVTYHGLESHASAAPWEGINALDAAITCYNSISQFRQQMKPTWRIHGIITEGGTKPNIIPARASLHYLARAPTLRELKVLKEAVTRCFEAAALSSNCKITYAWDEGQTFTDMIHCRPMVETYQKYAEEFGVEFPDVIGEASGSTDASNVSYAVPTIHPMYSIPTTATNHTKEFTEVSGSPAAQPATLIAAKCMAKTALDLLSDPELRKRAVEDFKKQKELRE